MMMLAGGLSYIDLRFDGRPGIIATAVLHGPAGVALIDPGPSSTLPALKAALGEAGIRVTDLTMLLLTHIHLDHAGACGTLVREHPQLQVRVHKKGAVHMADPSKLLASATRLYGDAMDRLWGEVRPVPQGNLVIAADGDRISAGGRGLLVAETPGHAVHHVSYFDADSGVAFVGDTAGVRVRPGAPVVPPTPPPDIDLEAWRASLLRIQAWRPDTLFLTHFGPSTPTAPHLAEIGDRLQWVASLVRQSFDQAAIDEERERWFIEQIRAALRPTMSDEEVRAFETAGRLDLSWKGLARYWRGRI